MRVPLLVGAAAAVGVAGGVSIALAHNSSSRRAQTLHAQATWSGKRAAPIRLRDEAGKTVSLASQQGRVVLLTFLDSRCRTQCPIEGGMLAQLERRLGSGSRAELVVVSVDPWADTAASARAFAAKAQWRFPWHWLLGTWAQLRSVWSSYAIAVKRTRTDVLHSVVLYVIDRNGDQRAAYLFPFAPAEVAADVRTIAAT